MIISLLTSSALVVTAVVCGLRLEFTTALIVWAALAAAACTVGAFLIFHQPLGVSTLGGRLGCGWVRWGFRAGRGQLPPAAMISWLIWLVLGSAVIAGLHFPPHLPIVVSWTVDILGLFYIAGIGLPNRSGRMPPSLFTMMGSLVAMIAVSYFFWFRVGTDGAQGIAVAIAGGPPLFLGAGYGVVLLIGLLTRRSHH